MCLGYLFFVIFIIVVESEVMYKVVLEVGCVVFLYKLFFFDFLIEVIEVIIEKDWEY